jgi:hypothetical protein
MLPHLHHTVCPVKLRIGVGEKTHPEGAFQKSAAMSWKVTVQVAETGMMLRLAIFDPVQVGERGQVHHATPLHVAARSLGAS